jgi:hypothetical protein
MVALMPPTSVHDDDAIMGDEQQHKKRSLSSRGKSKRLRPAQGKGIITKSQQGSKTQVQQQGSQLTLRTRNTSAGRESSEDAFFSLSSPNPVTQRKIQEFPAPLPVTQQTNQERPEPLPDFEDCEDDDGYDLLMKDMMD